MTQFRELMRIKQQLPEDECFAMLRDLKRGVLSVNGDNGYPYGMPLNHYYEDGYLYFHGGRSGHKIDALKKDCRASYCVYDEGYRNEGEWHLNIKSVIVFGRVEFIDDEEKVIEISRKLSHKFTNDDNYIDEEIRRSLKGTAMFTLKIEHISGKIVKEK